ncbi:protein FAM151A-like [Haliotis rufescens]|uniref:protein FAM151A-like n=1 Tax=Haliotis rufescens TaxID=6454 RepID=UPI00201F180B|nr:protein FAM151A-like [Haliotis rufescens]
MKVKLYYQLGGVVLLFGFTVYLLHRYISASHLDERNMEFLQVKLQDKPRFHSPLLKFFQLHDPFDIRWQHATSSDLDTAGGDRMVSVDIDSKMTLDLWLDHARKLRDVGLKLNFKNMSVLETCLLHLDDNGYNIHYPVIVHGDVALGNAEEQGALLADVFFFKIRTSYPLVTFSVGHLPTSVTNTVHQMYMEAMWKQLRNFKQPIFITVCASVIRRSWLPVKWLLNQSQNISLIITYSSGNDVCSEVSVFDLLFVWNDYPKERVFFDIPEVNMERFRAVATTAGSPLHYFGLQDAAKVTWAHRVTNLKYMNEAIKGDVMFLEGDVLLEGHDSKHDTPIPIMAHPPEVHSDLRVKDFLHMASASGKSIKLDFKSLESLEPSLSLLAEMHKEGGIKAPVWINADILTGPNTDQKGLNASVFLSKINTIFPEVTISIGWTTEWLPTGDNAGYSFPMVQTMNKHAIVLRQPVTFPVRASLVRKSWENLDWLLHQSRGYSLTVWTPSPNTDVVELEDMQFVRKHSEATKVYFDLPQDLMPT